MVVKIIAAVIRVEVAAVVIVAIIAVVLLTSCVKVILKNTYDTALPHRTTELQRLTGIIT